ncbi:Aminomethyltransferase (glycine cleavage system T protein) (EC 2.1.2.10), partial [Pseudomonas sp. FEN]
GRRDFTHRSWGPGYLAPGSRDEPLWPGYSPGRFAAGGQYGLDHCLGSRL